MNPLEILIALSGAITGSLLVNVVFIIWDRIRNK